MEGPVFERAYIRNGLSKNEYGGLIHGGGRGGLYSGGLSSEVYGIAWNNNTELLHSWTTSNDLDIIFSLNLKAIQRLK
jgi:hypothetical protein